MTVLTAEIEDPTGYGRIVWGSRKCRKIVEIKTRMMFKERSERLIQDVRCDAKLLKESVVDLNNDNQQKEYYITDVVEILNQKDIVSEHIWWQMKRRLWGQFQSTARRCRSSDEKKAIESGWIWGLPLLIRKILISI